MNDQQLQQFISTFNFLQKFNCFEAIDAMFVKMINEDWSQESFHTNKLLIVAFLRTNFAFKSKILHYDNFLKKSCEYLNQHNYDPKNLLTGLI